MMLNTNAGAFAPTAQRTRTARHLKDRATAPEVTAHERSAISAIERRRRSIAIPFRIAQGFLLVGLVVAGVWPLLWLAKAATSTSQDILRDPFALWPSGVHWENLANAWTGGGIGLALLNTAAIAVGSVIASLVISVLAAYILSVLRPRWAPALSALILATLFVPYVVSLVPQYLIVLDIPGVGISLLDTYWAVWLPAATNAFSVLVLKRFFDGLPRELFEAARIDGAGPLRVLSLVVLPLSRPILGALALLTFVASWKDFLWPLLVLPSTSMQPVSVRLSKLQLEADFGTTMGGLLLAVVVPVVLFLLFQRQVMRGVSLSGGIKG